MADISVPWKQPGDSKNFHYVEEVIKQKDYQFIQRINKIIFDETNVEGALDKWETTLTAWFNLNKKYDFAKKIKYANIPQYYTFENKKWKKRLKIRKNIAIGRLNVVSPKNSERFFLKLILSRVKGATSFKDLRTYENITYSTYRKLLLLWV